ncbi:nitroreductase family deazaflavin-dependent oxidoreductase [Microbacterium sp. NEAU-LLC]|uniref:Nitroreductase family deazaflavin-dependent oxidoreductase n=2 Tax=Microbacterium helvum TaxID=2773713 RepID=A0ABR8NKC7_9MICO|nr:nitroreductase family deazaflavin-dependent oxidoreductase [Microbacterium helvum]
MAEHPSVAERILRMRWLMRAPIPLYRAGWGWLLGHRLLMIEHLGRASHQPRFVVVEVVDRKPNVVRVASGFGHRAQWYRNLRANGVAYLSTGTAHRVLAKVQLLDAGGSAAVLREYSRRHPFAWRLLGPALTSLSGDAVTPIVEFTRPEGWTPHHTPPSRCHAPSRAFLIRSRATSARRAGGNP